MNDLISVIVPVYNVERYLRNCVDSLINQSYKKLEIILVDDGSPDNCASICDEYAARDPRVKVIHQKNKGLSGARNSGLLIAKGQYIGFVDSDDMISLYMYEILLNSLLKWNADVATCLDTTKYENLYSGGISIDNKMIKLITNPLEYYLKYDCNSVWRRLYKRDAIENISFIENAQNEDILFTHYVMRKINRLVKVFLPLYFYNCEPQSLSRSPIKDLYNPFDEILEYSHQKNDDPEVLNGILLSSLRFQFRLISRSTRLGLMSDIKTEYEKRESIFLKNIRKYFFRITFSSLFTYREKIQVLIICLNLNLYKYLVHRTEKQGLFFK